MSWRVLSSHSSVYEFWTTHYPNKWIFRNWAREHLRFGCLYLDPSWDFLEPCRCWLRILSFQKGHGTSSSMMAVRLARCFFPCSPCGMFWIRAVSTSFRTCTATWEWINQPRGFHWPTKHGLWSPKWRNFRKFWCAISWVFMRWPWCREMIPCSRWNGVWTWRLGLFQVESLTFGCWRFFDILDYFGIFWGTCTKFTKWRTKLKAIACSFWVIFTTRLMAQDVWSQTAMENDGTTGEAPWKRWDLGYS